MANNQITREEIKKIMESKGEVRGVVFVTDMRYILEKEGREGLERVEKKTREWGFPINYKDIKNTTWLPVGLRAASILAAKEVFGWDEKIIFDMGHSAPQYSFMVKFLMRHFISLKMTYQKSPTFWPTHYTAGKLEAPEYNGKGKYFVLQLKDLNLHPALCPYYAGYFLRIAEFASTYPNMKIEERRCSFSGSSYHEYIVSWD